MRFSRFLFLCIILSFLQANATQSEVYCDSTYIDVHSLSILCDSPYTYYYGNGAHRNSEACDYGDKVTLTMTVDVLQELDDDTSVYASMTVSINKEVLYQISFVDLCANWIENNCKTAGTYQVTQNIQFAYISGGSSTKFTPYVAIGLSSAVGGDYDIGGLNIACYNSNTGTTTTTTTTTTTENFITHFVGDNATNTYYQDAGTFGNSYGILVGTVVVVAIFALVLVKQNGDRRRVLLDPKMVELYSMS